MSGASKRDLERAVLLATGEARPANGMEKHFVAVVAGEARPHTPEERVWYEHAMKKIAWEQAVADTEWVEEDNLAAEADYEETYRELLEEFDDYTESSARSDEDGWFYSDDG